MVNWNRWAPKGALVNVTTLIRERPEPPLFASVQTHLCYSNVIMTPRIHHGFDRHHHRERMANRIGQRLALLPTVLLLGACRPPESSPPVEHIVHSDRPGLSHSFGRAHSASPVVESIQDWTTDVDYLDDMLRRVWIHATPETDWDTHLQPLHDFAASTPDREAFANATRDALCSFNDAGLRLAPKDNDQAWSSGLTFAVTEDGLVVTHVDARYANDVQPGDIVRALDGIAIDHLELPCVDAGSASHRRPAQLAQQLELQALRGDTAPAHQQVTLATKDHTEMTLDLQWVTSEAPSSSHCVSVKPVGILTFISFSTDACPDQQATPTASLNALDDALSATTGNRAIAIDLRDLSAADYAFAEAIASRFAPAGTPWHRRRSQTSGTPEAYRDVMLPHYSGITSFLPTAVLIDERCTGYCELLAAFFSERDQTTLIGRRTIGMVSESRRIKLPRSELRIDIPDTTFAASGTSTPIDSSGIVPDLEVEVHALDIRNQRDPIADAVLSGSQRAPSP